MGKKTINQALKDLFLGLGGSSSALSDNTTVSDYIEDLESAIKSTASGASEDLIDDTTASETKVYSSSKVESLIPTDELPSVTSEDINDVLTVVSDGEGGAKWDKVTPTSGGSDVVLYPATIVGNTVTLSNDKKVSDILTDMQAGKAVIINDGTNTYYSSVIANNYIAFSSMLFNYAGAPVINYVCLYVAKDSTGNTLTQTNKTL